MCNWRSIQPLMHYTWLIGCSVSSRLVHWQSTARKSSWCSMWKVYHTILMLFTVTVMGQWWHHRCGKSGQMSKVTTPCTLPKLLCVQVWKAPGRYDIYSLTIEAMNFAKLNVYLFPTFRNGLPKVLLHVRLWITMSTWTLFNSKS